MSTWSNDEVIQWLTTNGFEKYTRKFQGQQIDGHRFLRLTDEEIVQFLTRSNDDGTEERPTIGAKTRFRTKFRQLKRIDAEEQKKIPIETIRPEEEKTPRSIDVVQQDNYPVDNEDHLPFFRNPKFVDYFLDHFKKQTDSKNIKIIENQSSPSSYIILLNGTEQEVRTVRDCLQNLFQSIQTKEFQRPIMKYWMLCSTAKNIIQNLFDCQTSLWTICDLHGMIHPTLKITFFNDEKFNGTSPIPLIDEFVEKQICVERILIKKTQWTRIVEYVNLNQIKIIWKETLCFTQSYEDEYRQILHFYQQNNSSFISIVERQLREKMAIDIFGSGKLVTKLLRELEDLFKKHRRQKFFFTQLSTSEIDCLFQLRPEELKQMEWESENSWVKFDWNKSFFYAPEYAKDQIESRMKQIFTRLERQMIKTEEFYYETHRQIESKIQTLSRKYRCYSTIKTKTKLKSFPVMKQLSDAADFCPLTIDSRSPTATLVCQVTFPNGSIKTSIGDITQQQTDVVIIPLFSSGLREYLIQCAGDIRETSRSTSFITETTAGNLKCQKILFVDWSLPKYMTSEDSLVSSIQFFLSRVFKYLIKHDKSSNGTARSIAVAMPEIFHNEQIFSEEFLNEMINQIHSNKSLSFQISLIFLPNQEKFYQQVTDALQLYQSTGNSYGIFYCPSTVLSITLYSLTRENLERFQKILETYLKRSKCTKQLNSFDHWNQQFISQFYSSAQQRSVLPKFNDQEKQIILYGSIIDVEQLYHQYQLTNISIHIRGNFPDRTSFPNVILYYTSNDAMAGERLCHRLTNDGFRVTSPSDSSEEDFIIFCIGDDALDDDHFREVLISFNARGKKLIPLQVQPYRTTRWLRKLIKNQYIFRFFGSDEYLNLQYQKIILKIFQLSNVEQNDEDLLKIIENDPPSHFLLTVEQRKSIQEQKLKKIFDNEKNQFSAEEREKFLSLIEETIKHKDKFPPAYVDWFFDRQIVKGSAEYQHFRTMINEIHQQTKTSPLREWINQFLEKSTKQNLPPFSPTGDFNDVPFLSSITDSSTLPLNILFGADFWSFDRTEESIEESDSTIAEKESIVQRSLTKKQDGIDAELDALLSPLEITHSSNSTRVDPPVTNHVECNRQKYPGMRPVSKYPSFGKAATNVQCQLMIKQLRKGFKKFQRLCDEYQPRTEEPIQQDVKAIFTPSPFDNTDVHYRKALQTRPYMDLPLKFLWNGVSEIDERKSKRNDASVLFFFEPALASEHH